MGFFRCHGRKGGGGLNESLVYFRLTFRTAKRERGGEETGCEEAEKKGHTLL